MSVLVVGGVGVALIGAALLIAVVRRDEGSASKHTDEPAARDIAERNIVDARIAVDRLRGRLWPQ